MWTKTVPDKGSHIKHRAVSQPEVFYSGATIVLIIPCVITAAVHTVIYAMQIATVFRDVP